MGSGKVRSARRPGRPIDSHKQEADTSRSSARPGAVGGADPSCSLGKEAADWRVSALAGRASLRAGSGTDQGGG